MKTTLLAYLMHSLKIWTPGVNPIPEILDTIPYGDTVLDPTLCDTIRKLINKGNPKLKVDDEKIISLLVQLKSIGLIDIVELAFPSAHGKILIIKRKING